MSDTGRQARMPRYALPSQTPSVYAVVFWVAFGVSTLLVAGQIAFILSITPAVVHAAEKAAVELPVLLSLAQFMGPIGLFLTFAIGDALVFAGFAYLARRYWIGLLFVPPILYLAGAFGALWIFATRMAFAG